MIREQNNIPKGVACYTIAHVHTMRPRFGADGNTFAIQIHPVQFFSHK